MNRDELEKVLEALDYAERVLSQDSRASRLNVAKLAKDAAEVVRAEIEKLDGIETQGAA